MAFPQITIKVGEFTVRQFHFNVMFAVWLIIATFLLLHFFLNSLKYHELVVGATSDRMQVTADVIESAIVRAELVGLRLNEIENLDFLIERQLEQAPLIDDIRIIDPGGRMISGTDNVELSDEARNLIVLKALTRGTPVFTYESEERLFSSRIVLDSASTPMGIILVSTDQSVYQSNISGVRNSLGGDFLLVFGAISALVIPLILIGFRRFSRAVDYIEARLLGESHLPVKAEEHYPDLLSLGEKIDEGNAAYKMATMQVRSEDREKVSS